MMSSHMEEVERRSAALYKAPRVSLDDIKAAIVRRHDFTAAMALDAMSLAGVAVTSPKVIEPVSPKPATYAADAPEALLSICLLVMRNGFTIIGKSAPASAGNFDVEYGKQLAYEDAVKQVWPLMGYALRDRLHTTATYKDSQKVAV
jgi:hypothetical protein